VTKKIVAILLAILLLLSFSVPILAIGTTANRRYIPWTFTVYEEPDFRARPVASFYPQYVNIINSNGYGWAQISTVHGLHWLYYRGNYHYIHRAMGLFEYAGSASHVAVIYPQVVSVREQEGQWLQISTWLGPKWIHLDFSPPTYELTSLLRRFGNNLSVYYENLDTGFIFRHNADRVYFSASIPKASFALYIYMKAERGEIDLDSSIVFTVQDYMGGSGVIRHRYPVGTPLTHREILGLNLFESDNIATNMLRRVHGTMGYRQFVSEIGGNSALVRNRIFDSHITANEAGLFAREIFRYIESDGTYSAEFKEHLLNNQFPFIVSDYPVASKTGWTRPIAWHDMAIVYAPSPFILVILSARNGWTDADYKDFEEISMAFQEFNNRWFVSPSAREESE